MLQRVAQIAATRNTLIIQLGAKFFKTSIFDLANVPRCISCYHPLITRKAICSICDFRSFAVFPTFLAKQQFGNRRVPVRCSFEKRWCTVVLSLTSATL
jgi:hypothetical protein